MPPRIKVQLGVPRDISTLNTLIPSVIVETNTFDRGLGLDHSNEFPIHIVKKLLSSLISSSLQMSNSWFDSSSITHWVIVLNFKYPKMRDALLKAGWTIIYSLCEW